MSNLNHRDQLAIAGYLCVGNSVWDLIQGLMTKEKADELLTAIREQVAESNGDLTFDTYVDCGTQVYDGINKIILD